MTAPQSISPVIVQLVKAWHAKAKEHALAALDGDCEVGDEEWCLHRETARIYRACADQLEAITLAQSSAGIAEAFDDLKSHRDAWRGAIASHCTPFGSDDDGSYWDHELRAFDRTFDALTRHVAQRSTEHDTIAAGLALWIKQTHAMWLAGDISPDHMRRGKALASGHGRHIPQTSPAPGCDSGSHPAQPSAGIDGFWHRTAVTLLEENKRLREDAQPPAQSKAEWFCEWLQGYLTRVTGRDELDAFEANTIRNTLNETMGGTSPLPSTNGDTADLAKDYPADRISTHRAGE